MADSNSVRSARKRAHAAGDHSLCRRCAALTRPAPVLAAVPDAGPAGEVDAAGGLAALVVQLAAAHRADPLNGVMARELRLSLALLTTGREDLGDATDPVEFLRGLGLRGLRCRGARSKLRMP